MGCWNATCAVTNLPIFYGEEVYSVFLGQKEHKNFLKRRTWCHPNEVYTPIGVWFTGEYDDYGKLENCCDKLDFNVELFKEYIVEQTPPEDTYTRQLEVNSNLLNTKSIFEFDIEGQLILDAGYYIYDLTHITVKKDVFESIMNYNPKGYDDMTLKDDILAGIQHQYEEFKKYEMMFPQTDYRVKTAFNLPKLVSMFKDAKISNNQQQIDILEDHILKSQIFDTFMDHSRKTYHIPSGAGSQDQNTDCQQKIAEMILDQAEKIERRYDEP